MASKVKVKINIAGGRALMRSAEMQALMAQYGQQIAARAGTGYTFDTYVGLNRANATVFAGDRSAAENNMDNNTLLKSMR